MKIRVSVLGAGGSYPPPGYAGPCILLERGDNRLLVDPGEGCLPRLAQAGLGPCSVGEAYVSHLHVDHWAGLPSIAIARKVEGCGPLRVWAPWLGEEPLPSTLERLASHGYISLSQDPGPAARGLGARPVRVEHSVATYGLRAGPVFYSADTILAGSVVEAASGSGLVLAEATLPPGVDREKAGMHMSVEDAVRLGVEAGARILGLVHLSPYSLGWARKIVAPEGLVVLYGEGYTLLV